MSRSIANILSSMSQLDSDRFYVENVRQLLRASTRHARVICEAAVRTQDIDAYYIAYCPNRDCGRVITSAAGKEELSDRIICLQCEELGQEECEWAIEDLKVERVYRLNTEKK